jgi:tight adherence protein C
MGALFLWGLCFGAGALLLLTAQPLGAPKPSLAERLAALRPAAGRPSHTAKVPVFKSRVFEDVFRPIIEEVGAAVASAAGRVGIGADSLERRLQAAGDRGGLPLYIGQKIASGTVAFLVFPIAASLRLGPHFPMWVWVVAAVAGFFLPDALLAGRVRHRRMEILEGLAQATELLALGVASGLALEQAIDEMARGGAGPLFDELRSCLKRTRVDGHPASRALDALAERTDLPQAASLAAAVQLAEQGAPVRETLRAQAHAMRETRRLSLLEAGERSEVRMALPVGVFILPAFFVLLLYPAAIHLLQVTGP